MRFLSNNQQLTVTPLTHHVSVVLSLPDSPCSSWPLYWAVPPEYKWWQSVVGSAPCNCSRDFLISSPSRRVLSLVAPFPHCYLIPGLWSGLVAVSVRSVTYTMRSCYNEVDFPNTHKRHPVGDIRCLLRIQCLIYVLWLSLLCMIS